MATTEQWIESFTGDEETVHLRRPVRETTELDMTPMIDCVFLLLVFFLVSSIPDLKTMVELPPARHGVGANPRTAVFVTVADGGGESAEVYLGDGKVGAPLSRETAAMQADVARAVEEGQNGGKESVIIKGERTLKFKHISQVAAAVGQVEDMRLFLAVYETE